MKYIFFLLGDHPELARAEVTYLLKSSHPVKLLDSDTQIAIVETKRFEFSRLALIHEICEFIASCNLNELEDLFDRISVPKQTVCVRVKKIGRRINTQEMEKKLGAIFWRRGARISVSKPEKIIKVYISDKNRAYIGFLLHLTDKKQFLLRHDKPFFRPGVTLPRFARALVNLSGVQKHEILLDPMCGTGTILIEAGLMGVNFVGVEAFDNIVKGCALNLRYFNLPDNIVQGDARNLPYKDETFHAIVTDFPYLQSSRSYGKLTELYSESIQEFHRVLKASRRAVIVSNLDIDGFISEYFEIEEKFYQRVHKNLTRRIFLCKKTRS
jgi:tRNA (guanine10-N2)-dimethyltransferase